MSTEIAIEKEIDFSNFTRGNLYSIMKLGIACHTIIHEMKKKTPMIKNQE
jgi:hypothetical protein